MWFSSKEREAFLKQILALETRVSDLLDQLHRKDQEFAKERQEILDRFMASLSPIAYKSYKNPSPNPLTSQGQAQISFFPGSRPDLRPPNPQVDINGNRVQTTDSASEELQPGLPTLVGQKKR